MEKLKIIIRLHTKRGEASASPLYIIIDTDQELNGYSASAEASKGLCPLETRGL